MFVSIAHLYRGPLRELEQIADSCVSSILPDGTTTLTTKIRELYVPLTNGTIIVLG